MYSISSVQWLSHVRLFVTPWIAARQASLFKTHVHVLHKTKLIPPSYLLKVISPHALWAPATIEFLILRVFEL